MRESNISKSYGEIHYRNGRTLSERGKYGLQTLRLALHHVVNYHAMSINVRVTINSVSYVIKPNASIS